MKSLGEIKIKYFYSRHLGPRYESAGIELNLSISNKYKFINKKKDIDRKYLDAIKKGVLAGLKDIDFDINNGVRIELIDYTEHPVDFCEVAFYIAARIAIRSRIDISEITKDMTKAFHEEKNIFS